MEDFLVFDNVSKQYGSTRAVDGVTLRIQRGEIFSLLGPSGCGKTTLLRMAAGFEAPDSGRLLLEGQDITAVPPHRRPVNTVFQNYALFPHLSVRENIAFGPRIAGKADRQAVEAMIALVKLDGHADKKPAQLSGGQRQRVAIARALINQPRVLLLDEPLAALDLKLRQHMLGELQALHRATGTTFIFVTHDQTEAIGLSHRIAVMNAGRVEQCGTPREIYERPASGFVAEFIGDTNLLDATVREMRDDLCTVDAGVLGTLQAQGMTGLSAGAKVRLCVRPESWWISASADARPNAIPARVQSCLYLGAHSRWTLEAGGQLLHLLVPHQQRAALPIAPGSAVWAGFDPADAQVLAAS